LLTVTIRTDLRLTTIDVANSNIAALTGTLVVRFIAGPLCDLVGPRKTFVAILLAGAIPTAMAGLVTNVRGLIALRFFVGILGGSFVPCQVWSMGFFDKNVVGTSNALIGGWVCDSLYTHNCQETKTMTDQFFRAIQVAVSLTSSCHCFTTLSEGIAVLLLTSPGVLRSSCLLFSSSQRLLVCS